MSVPKTKLWTTCSLLAVYFLCFILVILRWINLFDPGVWVIHESINAHITNFTLSLMGCTLIGYVLLAFGKGYTAVCWVGGLAALANVVYEGWLPFLNTLDWVDAVYGIVGVAVGMIYLYFVGKYGFVRAEGN